MKAPKFDFVPERSLKSPIGDTKFRVSIYKTGTLVFSNEVVKIYDLDGKYIRLYADRSKRSIGWSYFDNSVHPEEMADARLLKALPAGHVVVSIKKLLKSMGIEDLGDGHKQLEVGVYKAAMQPNDIYYVTLPEKEVEITIKHKE